MGIKDRIDNIIHRGAGIPPSVTPPDASADTGIRNRFKNLFNRGTDAPPPVKSADLGSVEAEFQEITKKLEHERRHGRDSEDSSDIRFAYSPRIRSTS